MVPAGEMMRIPQFREILWVYPDFSGALPNPEFINELQNNCTKINTGAALSQAKHIGKDKRSKPSPQDEPRRPEFLMLRSESLSDPLGI